LKKILILSVRTGEEEDVAAMNLRDACDHLASAEARVETIDLFDSCFGRFEGLLGLPFRERGPAPGRMREALADVLQAGKPDVVVVTSAFYLEMIGEIYRSGRTRDFTLIALAMHDSPEASATSWAVADHVMVAHERASRALAEAALPPEKIRVSGFPLQLAGRNADRDSTLPDLAAGGRPRILYLINTARKKAPKLLDRLLEHPDWEITAGVGHDAALQEMARARATWARDRLEVIGPGCRLPELLRRHHLVISRAETAVVQESIAARCPLVAPKIGPEGESANLAMLTRANGGAQAARPREVIDWLERAFQDGGRLLQLWRKNLEPLGRPDGALTLARFILEQAAESVLVPLPVLHALPPPAVASVSNGAVAARRLRRLPKQLVLCDLHTHTTWSDGKLTVPEIVDFYGRRGFDCLCITDHLCDPARLLGRLVNLTGLVIPPGEIDGYFEAIEREKKRAWAKYDLLLMTGVEFNKDGYTAKSSTHLLGVDLRQPINPSLDIKGLIAEIHAQGGLAIASHPHEVKSSWGKNTLYLWENIDEYAPLLDAWEVANRDDIFNPVGLKKLPFIASSDFHKPKHIRSWKTVLYCEKEPEAIKHCIRVNRDVSLTLYRDQRFGWDERHLPLPAIGPDAAMGEMETPLLHRG
jgi:predicted metal-dependent phosphoesterase TrpH/UDP-N-acetylglucosamine:LPS N-acetylglucosamine transferase